MIWLIFKMHARAAEQGGLGGLAPPPLFTDHFKNDILFDYSDTENCFNISDTKIGL